MPVVPDDIAGLLTVGHNGTLATLRKDGGAQLSLVAYAWYPEDGSNDLPDPAAGPDGPAERTNGDRGERRAVVRISTVDGRAKVANLRRDPRASFLVSDDIGWSYAVVEGRVELSPVAKSHDDDTVEELIRVYRDANGEHPDWADYRRAMVEDHRLVARLVVEHAYGLVRS